jgi:hypothetical protein
MPQNTQNIQALIDLLNKLKATLDPTSETLKTFNRLLQKLGDAQVKGISARLSSEVDNVLKIFDNLEKESNRQINLMGESFRAGLFKPAVENIKQNPPYTLEAGPFNQTTNQLSKAGVPKETIERVIAKLKSYASSVGKSEDAFSSLTKVVYDVGRQTLKFRSGGQPFNFNLSEGKVRFPYEVKEDKSYVSSNLKEIERVNKRNQIELARAQKQKEAADAEEKSRQEAAKLKQEEVKIRQSFVNLLQSRLQTLKEEEWQGQKAQKSIKDFNEADEKERKAKSKELKDYIIGKYEEQEKQEAAKLAELAKQRTQENREANRQEQKARDEIIKEQRRAIRLVQEQLIEQERQAALQQGALKELPAGSGQKVFDLAKERGFQPENLKNVTQEGSTGISTLHFQATSAEGVVRNLSVTVDKFGTILTDTQKRFRTFTQAIFRDIGEVAKWSIAVSLVYAPMYKLNQLVDEMIENEARLAEVMVALGSATQSTQEVFSAVAKAANDAGESISGVLEGYAFAYRATGDIKDATERFAIANKLLADSLTLSKLSTLDQAEAIDTLSASLRQTGRSLDEGQVLLDQWVRATKVANVDLTTLATGYAVLGDAAEAAGIEQKDLNGLIATIAETGVASGKEVANIAKAIVAGFQSDQGVKAIEALGIATEDLSTGKLKPFLDLVEDISDKIASGIITPEQSSKLALDIGGGPRRSPAVQTLLQNFSRVRQINDEVAKASGDASQAMETQTNTVETAITRLGNSFLGLAETLGDNGGLLDVFKVFITALGDSVTVLEKLLELMGKSGPMLASVGLATLYFRTRPKLQRDDWINSIGGLFGKKEATVYTSEGPVTQKVPNNLVYNYLKTGGGIFGRGLTGLGFGAIPAIQNALNGDSNKAFGDLAGGLIGGMVAGPIGAAVGASIAESFVSSALDYKPQWENFFADVIHPEKAKSTIPESLTSVEVRQEELMKQAFKEMGFGSEPLGKIIAEAMTMTQNNPAGDLVWAGGTKLMSLLGNIFAGTQFGTRMQYQGSLVKEGPITKEYLAKLLAPDWLQDELDSLNKKVEADKGFDSKANVQTQDKLRISLGSLVEEIKKQIKEALLDQLITGEITQSAYNQKVERIGTADTVAIQYLSVFGQEVIDMDQTDQIKDMGDAFDFLMNIIIDSTPEAINALNALAEAAKSATDKQDLIKYIKYLQEARKELEEAKEKQPSIQQLDITAEQLPEFLAGYEARKNSFVQAFSDIGFKPKEEMIAVELGDGTLKKLNLDLRLIQGVLEDILKTEEKQLEGVYNLPEGASAYVPLQAAELRPKNDFNIDPMVQQQQTTNQILSNIDANTKQIWRVYADNLAQSGTSISSKDYEYDRFDGAERLKDYYDYKDFDPMYGYEYYDNARKEALQEFQDKEQLRKLQDAANGNLYNYIPGGTNPSDPFSFFQNFLQNFLKSLKINQNIDFENKTTLTMDGRQVANVVKQYIVNDLVMAESGSSSTSYRFVG